MKTLTFVLSFAFLYGFIGCKQKEDIFMNIPIANTQNFIDSINHKVWLEAGNNFTAHPTLQKDGYYYDERNLFDSIGNLEEYSIIQCLGDTVDFDTNYHYYKNQLISVNVRYIEKNKFAITKYFFRNRRLVETECRTKYKYNVPGDTLINRAERYLAIKREVGDPQFRKYFGRESHPPNSTMHLDE